MRRKGWFQKEENRQIRSVWQTLCLILAVLFLLSGSSGCAGKAKADGYEPSITPSATTTPTPTPVPTPEPTPLPTPTPEPTPDPMAAFIYPDSAVRPVAVMIDNEGGRPLPQAGLVQAQIVYEVLTEYKITRYMAVFWDSMPEMIGPVRSSRDYFLDYAMEYDAVYTHYGWSPQAQKDISRLHIQNINGLVNGGAFWDTDKNKGNWQDSFTSKDRVLAHIEKLKYRTTPKQGFPFTYATVFAVPFSGTTATKIDFVFGKGFTAGYTYNAETRTYDRIRNDAVQTERNTGAVVSPQNILVQIVPSRAIAGDEKYRIHVDTLGKGKGWYITGGKSRGITWSKAARDAQTKYLFEDGSPLVLNPGQMWIEVIPSAKTVTVE